MVSHRIFSPISCVFFYHTSRFRQPKRCFGSVSRVFRTCFGRVARRTVPADALVTLRAVILDRSELAQILNAEVPSGVRGVTGVAHDSRSVRPRFAFVAISGFKHDGTAFVPEALRRGASLVVAERGVPGAPAAVVPDARRALSALAREVHGDPSRSMEVYGVTGTNGKTTTSYALYSILACAYGEGQGGRE